MMHNLQFTKEELKKIGTRVRATRILCGLRREDLAKKQDIGIASLKNWEQGRLLPKYDAIVATINTLKESGVFISLEWLLFGNGAGPNYYETNNFNEKKNQDDWLDEQIKLFKKIERSLGFNPITFILQDDTMTPMYKKGDLLGGVLVSHELVKTNLSISTNYRHPWLISLTNGSFIPAFIYINNNRWFINTLKHSELKEIPLPTIAKIKWHYAVGENV